jgi:release factor glutamine methyltransferase
MERGAAAPTYAARLREADAELRDAGVPTARLDAEVLLCWAMSAGRAAVYAGLRDEVSPRTDERFAAALARRARREPLAYITGVREFWSLPFAVTPAVLIPRPETELLVETVVAANRGGPLLVCDLGTGSGCIAVAIARALPAARVIALDVDPQALAVARRNVLAHGVADRVELVRADAAEALQCTGRFDVVVSNPPYVTDSERLAPELEYEPRHALRSGADGLDLIRRLIAAAPALLRPGGQLVMEIGHGQEGPVRRLAAAAGLEGVSVEPDLAGAPRALIGHRKTAEGGRPAPARGEEHG